MILSSVILNIYIHWDETSSFSPPQPLCLKRLNCFLVFLRSTWNSLTHKTTVLNTHGEEKSLENYKNNLRKAYHCHITYTDPQYIGGVGIILSSIPNLTQKSWFFPSCSTADICFLEKKTHSTSQPSACALACSNPKSLKSPGMKIRDAKIAFPILLKICHWCKNRHAQSVGIPLLLPCLK